MTKEPGFTEPQDPAAFAEALAAAAQPEPTSPLRVAEVAQRFTADLPPPNTLDSIRTYASLLPERPSRFQRVVNGLCGLVTRVIHPSASHLQRTAAELPSTPRRYGFIFYDWADRRPDNKA